MFASLILSLTLLTSRLGQFVASHPEAKIGVAAIYDGCDTVSVNGSDAFPMLSVYKFPQALAVADYCQRNGLSLSDSIDIRAGELLPDTWSPMRDRYGSVDLRLPIRELLGYTLQQSDNNACDILFRLIGGPSAAHSLMMDLRLPEIRILSTEEEMHRDVNLCYANTSTPLAMASLFDRFNRAMRNPEIAELLETCQTGLDRIPAALKGRPATLGHKTGTGDKNSRGEIIAVNDCAYINFPDGHTIALAIFISDSTLTPAETEALIADLTALLIPDAME